MDYGNRLFELRKRKLLSQEDVANELGVSRQSISLWETNQASPSMENLILFAKLFNVSLDELVGLKDNGVILDRSIDEPLFTVEYLEDKNVVYRRDYKYLNSVTDSVMFFLSLLFYFMAIAFMFRAPSLVIGVARIFMIIAFVFILIGSLIYPLYTYINVKRKVSNKSSYHLEFNLDYVLIQYSRFKDVSIRYEMINYYIAKKDYMIVYLFKGDRLYIPNSVNNELDEFLSKQIEKRNRKKLFWK